jgi:hypothetical protein
MNAPYEKEEEKEALYRKSTESSRPTQVPDAI